MAYTENGSQRIQTTVGCGVRWKEEAQLKGVKNSRSRLDRGGVWMARKSYW